MLELTKEVAETLVKKTMEPIRKALEEKRTLTEDELKFLDQSLGMIGMAMARLYAKDKEYQGAFYVLSQENVRLNELLEGKKKKSGFSSGQTL